MNEVTETQTQNSLSYCHFVSELLERANLFVPIEFKIIAVLVKRLDYSLNNFNVAISLAELQTISGLGKGSVLQALGNLQSLGLIEKISGKYDQELAREIRKGIYKKGQRKTRSFNEVNIYNLSGLYSFLLEVIEFDREYARRYQEEFGYRLKPIDYPSRQLTHIRRRAYKHGKSDFTYFDLLDHIRRHRHIDQSDWSNIDQSDRPYMDQSDCLYIDQEPRSKKENPSNVHTHNQEHNGDQKGEEQGKVAQGVAEKSKVAQQVERPAKEKKKPKKPFDRISDPEFRQFILDFLAGSPSIQNPIAVAKTLTEEDIAYYHSLYIQNQREQAQQQQKEQQQQEKPQEPQEELQEGERKELLKKFLEFAKTFFEKGEKSALYSLIERDTKRVMEENGKIMIVCKEHTAKYIEREFGERIKEFFGREIEFREE